MLTPNSKPEFTATDYRRASALLTHAVAGDEAGVQLIWAECVATEAVPDLFAALVALFFWLNPGMASPEGHEALVELTRSWAAAEAAGGS